MADHPIVIFDIEGVANLPGFEEKVLRPLELKGTNYLFWTGSPNREHALRVLEESGIKANREKIISAHEAYLLRQALEEASSAADEGLAEKLRSITGLPYEEEDVSAALQTLSYWKDLSIKTSPVVKFPPALGRGPFIWVESDNAYPYTDESSMRREIRGVTNSQKIVSEAERLKGTPGEFSLLMLPESPRHANEITAFIERTITSWKGEAKVQRVSWYEFNEGQTPNPEKHP